MTPMNQQQTIGALIAIARAARAVVESDRATGAALTEVSSDALDNLDTHLASLDHIAGEGDQIDLAAACLRTITQPERTAYLAVGVKRVDEPTITAEKCEDPVVEANRQLLLARSKVGISKYSVTLGDSGLSRDQLLQHALEESLDLSNYLQAELQRSRAERDEVRTSMIADTADEALRIINDADLLANLHEMFDGTDATGGRVEIINWHVDEGCRPVWSVEVSTGTGQTKYESTSFHQAIAVAHKGEHDLRQPEHEECQFCGFTVETPCDAPPPAECPVAVAAQVNDMNAGIAQANEMQDNLREHGTIDKPAERRNHMVNLITQVKDRFGADSAKSTFGRTSQNNLKMADIPDDQIQFVIAACEHKLKEPK